MGPIRPAVEWPQRQVRGLSSEGQRVEPRIPIPRSGLPGATLSPDNGRRRSPASPPSGDCCRQGDAMLARSFVAAALVGLCTFFTACVPQSSAHHGPSSATSVDAQDLARLQADVATLKAKVDLLEAENAALRSAGGSSGSPHAEGIALGVVAVPPHDDSTSQPGSKDPTVYVTPTGSRYHLPTCRHAATGSATPLSTAARTLQPCKLCNPPAAVASTAAPTSSPTPVAAPSASSPRPTTRPTASGQCSATTQKGTRCKRTAKSGSAYCWQHG
jgi:hypothetical protein